MELDQTHLKDMGIKKVGDRVRINSQAKQLRNKEYKKASRRTSNRVRYQIRSPPSTTNIYPAIIGDTRQRRLCTAVIKLSSTLTLRTLNTRQLPNRKAYVPTNNEFRSQQLHLWHQATVTSRLALSRPRKSRSQKCPARRHEQPERRWKERLRFLWSAPTKCLEHECFLALRTTPTNYTHRDSSNRSICPPRSGSS
jgi:hypothetical protein